MTDRDSLRALLNTATLLINERKLDEAEDVLRGLETSSDHDALGPETVLGLPRRLHAAKLKLAKARADNAAKIALQYTLVPPTETLRDLFSADAAERARRVKLAGASVPKTLHQIWVGSSPPETTDAWRAAARRNGWAYTLWDEPALVEAGITDDPAYVEMRARGDLPGAVDVVRYHVLRNKGGLYLDCDWLPVGGAPFEDAIPSSGLSALAEVTPRQTGVGSPFLNNSVIAAPPDHPVFSQLIAALPEVLRRFPKGPAWWVTGPLVFTLASRLGPVTVLDAHLTAGPIVGGRDAADAECAALRDRPDPAFLLAWKPW